MLVSKIPILYNGIQPGDIIVFQHPYLGRLIKLVDRLEAGGRSIFVVGLNADSVDSRQFGPIPCGTVVGKVVWHIPARIRPDSSWKW